MKQKFEFRFGRNFTELTAIITLGCLLVFYGVVLLWPQGNPYDFVKLTIPKGASLKEVSNTLNNHNVINNGRSFQLAVKILGYEKAIDTENNWYEKAAIVGDPSTSGISCAIVAENIGDKNHEIIIPETPPTHGKDSVALYHITQSYPPVTNDIPIIPPTQE